MALEWDGVTRRETFHAWTLQVRDRLADAARDAHWDVVLPMLQKNPELVNACRPGGTSRYTPLHQAAYHGAPPEVVARLLVKGALRTLRDAKGERAVDIARRRGHDLLVPALEPPQKAPVPPAKLEAMQARFHEVIRGRAAEQVDHASLRLPELDPLTELTLGSAFWFAVPGMYGGFKYWLEAAGENPRLVSESWCRVMGGSGQRHVVRPDGSELVASGFV